MSKLTKQQIGGDWWLLFDGKPVAKFWEQSDLNYVISMSDFNTIELAYAMNDAIELFHFNTRPTHTYQECHDYLFGVKS